MKLIIGNKNYSTWSLRPWLLLQAFNVKFDEQLISLADEGLSQRLHQFSKSNKVPVLVDDGLTIWDTLAICEYISENFLDGKGWPKDVKQRAIARSVVAEMHAGFGHIRSEMHMNIKARRKIDLSDQAKVEIQRVDEIWAEYAQKDSYLFDDYSIADCFFTPVASRFQTYGVNLSPKAQAYADKLLNHPAMQEWSQAAKLETEVLAADEVGVEV